MVWVEVQDGCLLASSYSLDDVYGALPSAAVHTALKEAFFQPKGKSSRSSDPAPSLVSTLPPSPTSPFLPRFPWHWSKCFMWSDWGRSEVGPWPCPQKTLVFQRDESLLVLAGWSRRVERFIYFIYLGDGWNRPTGEEERKALEHFHMPPFLPACTCRSEEALRTAFYIHIYHLKITGN